LVGVGFVVWVGGSAPHPQNPKPPIPNPQSPIPYLFIFYNKMCKKNN